MLRILSLRTASLAALGFTLLPRLASAAQNTTCQPEWDTSFGVPSGVNDAVRALHVFDDGSGSGPALYAGGFFLAASGQPANRIAKWNGERWSPLGEGTNHAVFALTEFDDGAGGGPALYAGGIFNMAGGAPAKSIAKWDGQNWSSLGSGTNGSAGAMAVFDDGSGAGAALYVGGSFTAAGGGGARRIAKWNGLSWSAAGAGFNGPVSALTVFDDGSGSGPALYAAADFGVWKWNGQAWAQVGPSFLSDASALAVFDDGAGAALFAAGPFTSIGGVSVNRVAKLTGQTWSSLGSGVNDWVRALSVFDDGASGGPALYACGAFTSAGSVRTNRIARWNGQSWSALGAGVSGGSVGVSSAEAFALSVFDDGSGSGASLFVGGSFTTAGSATANNFAEWNAQGWVTTGDALNGDVRVLAELDLGGANGEQLYAGGAFTAGGSTTLNRIGVWNGQAWSSLGAGMNAPVEALAVFDDGAGGGPALYAGGEFATAGGVAASGIAKWDGQGWSSLGAGVAPGYVTALAAYDDGSGSALFVGGGFGSAGGLAAPRIAKWDGQSWSPLGTGIGAGVAFGPGASVHSLAVFDDGTGSGAQLYVGGHFTSAGGVATPHLAKWNGQTWSAVGGGIALGSSTLANFVDTLTVGSLAGSAPRLFVGGRFAAAGGVAVKNVATWNGQVWSALGAGLDGDVTALAMFDDGGVHGPSLFAGGSFYSVGSVVLPTAARWDGQAWSGVEDAGLFNVKAITAFDDGTGSASALYLGGGFGQNAGPYLAKWQGCPLPGTWRSYCSAGTSSNGCTPSINASGSPSVAATSGFTIDVTGVEGAKQGLIFYGINGRANFAWGAGSTSFQCVKAPVQRMGSLASGGTSGLCNGSFSVDWLAYLAASGGGLGAPFAAGEIVNAQAWYRDPPAAKTTNLSNALEFTLAP